MKEKMLDRIMAVKNMSIKRIIRTANYIYIPHIVNVCGSARSPEVGDGSLAHHILSKRKPLYQKRWRGFRAPKDGVPLGFSEGSISVFDRCIIDVLLHYIKGFLDLERMFIADFWV
jgi:hypothetical protein